MTGPIEAAARAWYDAGACVLPAVRGKRPAIDWKQHQQTRPTPEDMAAWNWAEIEGIGLVTGYGGFEMFELEGRAVQAGLVPRLVEAINAAAPGLVARLMTYCERTPSGGIHWIYRVDGELTGSTQLAREPRPGETPPFKVLIETRGRYAWTVLAPSSDLIHEDRLGGWSIIAGAPGVVATITEEEREVLFDCARALDQMPPPAPVEHRPASPPPTSGELSPGQDFEARADWMADILGPLGWRIWKREGDKVKLTRPGKNYGTSATINYDGNDNLYVFSSSTEFPAQTSWTKFGAYTRLHHGGDFSAAARDLRAKGYGSPLPEPGGARILPFARSAPGASTGGGGGVDGNTARAPDPVGAVPASLTDDGNALLLVSRATDRLLYVPEQKQWMAWDGVRWSVEPDDARPMQMFREIARAMKPVDAAEGKHKIKSLGFKSIENAVKLAARDAAIRIGVERLDADPMVLNTPGGMLNLITCEMAAPDPAGHHTRLTGVPVDFDMPCPRWLKFLDDTFQGQTELISYIQRLAGYSATGKVTHHILPFAHGTGGNGKGVFLEVMQAILGDYAGTAPADFLLVGGKEDSSAVAALSGLRFVVCSEVGPTAHFNEQKVKNLTGGERLTARFLYQKFFTFSPTHHLWLVGNHQPRVEAGGRSFWRRLRLLPFDNAIPESEQVEGLADTLVAEEGPAILAWIAAGARAQLGGLHDPEVVRAATADYAEEEDTIGRFLTERVHRGGDPKMVRVLTKKVYEAYEHWCFAEGVKQPLPSHVFGREMKARGIEKKASNGQNFYVRVTLLNPEHEDDERPVQTRF